MPWPGRTRLAPGHVPDLGELDGDSAPEAAAVAGDMETVAGAVEDVVGVLAERDRAARREARAPLRPRLPAVVGDEKGRSPVDEHDDRRAHGVHVEDAPGGPRRREVERTLALDGASGLVT